MTDILTRDEFTNKFSMKLDRLMRAKKISNSELANRTEITQSIISKYRRGELVPNTYTLYRIARALPCTIESLMDF